MTPRRAAEPFPLAPDVVPKLRSALLASYDRQHRSLPWRGEADPYRVLVSEVMLQQTRVETVERYYEPWLARFPDLETLADADEDAVLKAWEGLGYYRRARNLQSVARACRERPDGSLPSSYAELLDLPGVGEYTAGAVASIAFGERVPAADGNVRRVLARLFDVPSPRAPWLRETAAELVDPARPGDFNQALMELGATVCVPRAPRCGDCSVARWCRARSAGTQESRPAPSGRPSVRRAMYALAILRRGPRVLVQKRPDRGLLAGMWAFPEREVESPREAEGVALRLCRELGAAPAGPPTRYGIYEHRFTHLHATYLPYVVPVGAQVPGGCGIAWVEPGEDTDLALPVTQRRILSDLAPETPSTARAARRATRA